MPKRPDEAWLRDAYEIRGMTDEEIGRVLSMSGRSAGEWRSRYGIPTRSRHAIAAKREASKRPMDENQILRATDLRSRGYSVALIADELGVPVGACRNALQREGAEVTLLTKRRPRKLPAVSEFLDSHLLVTMYWGRKMSLTCIADCCRSHPVTVLNAMKRCGVPRRPPNDPPGSRLISAECPTCGLAFKKSPTSTKTHCSRRCAARSRPCHVSGWNRDRVPDGYIAGAGDRLKRIRREAGLTQGDLGDRIGLSGSFIGNYESNRYSISQERHDAWVEACAQGPLRKQGRYQCECGYATDSYNGWAGHSVKCDLADSQATHERDRWFVSKGGREWRRRCIARDKGTCQRCGRRGAAVHHKLAFSAFPDTRSATDNGICLCRRCHLWIHSNAGRAQREAWEAEALAALAHLLPPHSTEQVRPPAQPTLALEAAE